MSTETTPVRVNLEPDASAAPAADREVATAIPVTEIGGESRSDTPRMLYRHPSDRMLGGVCAGLADYLRIDQTLVRIIWAAATLFTGGGGVLAYAALWLLLPVGTASDGQKRPAAFELNERNLSRVALLLIGLGGLWLLANLGVLPWLLSAVGALIRIFFWPVLLIGAGYMLLRSARRGNLPERLGETLADWRSRFRWQSPDRDRVKAGWQRARNRIPLRRPAEDRMFLGVCSGIGRTLGIDANLVRLIWAAFSIGSLGTGVLIYVLLGLLLPEDVGTQVPGYPRPDRDGPVVDGTVTSL